MKAVSWLAQRDFESMFCAKTITRSFPVLGWLISAHDSALPKTNKTESQTRTDQIGKASRGRIKCHQAVSRPQRGADQAVAFVDNW
jgi:hypothetical protein